MIACGGEDNRLHIITEKDNNLKVKRKQQYLAIIPRAHVGYEMIDSLNETRSARVGYSHLISNKCEWNR